MIVLGVTLLILGLVLDISVLYTIGVVLLITASSSGSSARRVAPSEEDRTTGEVISATSLH